LELFIVNEIVDDYDDILNIRGVFETYDLAVDVSKKFLSEQKDYPSTFLIYCVNLNTTYKNSREVASVTKKITIDYEVKLKENNNGS
jgi:hypothetical protein